MIAIVCRGIGLVMSRDLLAGEAAATRQQVIALSGQEIVDLAQHNLQSVSLQLHVADDLGLQEADRVTRSRVSKSWKELVGNGSAANGSGSLQHRDFEALFCEIIGAGEAVVAGADDDCVVHGQHRHSGGRFNASTPVLRPSSGEARRWHRNRTS